MLSAGTALASSRRPLCGIFGHVLFPQDKEGFGSITSHEENCFVFSRSHRPPLTRTGKINGKILLLANAIPATRIHEDSLKKKTAFSACDVSQRSFPCLAGGKASVGPRSALARGGPPAARGKRSVYGVRLPK